MNREVMFGQSCIMESLVGRSLIESAGLVEIKNVNYDYAVKDSAGNIKITSEFEMAKKALLEGKGIAYAGKVIFNAGCYLKNPHYKRYLEERQAVLAGYHQVLGEEVVGGMKDLYFLPVVKSILTMYQEGFWSRDAVKEKLEKYLSDEAVASVLREETLELAG